jgi:hypothetical protein
MKKIISLFSIILILGICSSCEEYVHRKKIESLVKEWTGKTIVFVTEIPCISVMQDTICPCISNKPYKILLYTDAKGCESCKLQPNKWNILYILRRDRFDYPIHIDHEDKLNKLNKFPTDVNYQCFLLDKDDKVILIGNPFTNPSLWKLCKKIISENHN